VAKATASDLTRQQGKRLQRLRETRGLSRPLLADRLGFKNSQTYELYERGVSVIRFDQVPMWAAAFDVSYEDFLSMVIGEENPADGWTFRDALRGHIPEYLIDELADEWEGEPMANQRAAVRGILALAESQRKRATSHLDTSRAV